MHLIASVFLVLLTLACLLGANDRYLVTVRYLVTEDWKQKKP